MRKQDKYYKTIQKYYIFSSSNESSSSRVQAGYTKSSARARFFKEQISVFELESELLMSRTESFTSRIRAFS